MKLMWINKIISVHTLRRLLFCSFFMISIVAVILFVKSAFLQENVGFKVDKTQKGLLISKIANPINSVQLNDIIIAVNGLSYHELLGFFINRVPVKNPGTITVFRDGQNVKINLKTVPYTAFSLFSMIWPRLVLMIVFLTLGSIVIFKAPPSPVVTLFFLMLCCLSTSLAATIPSSIVFLSPLTYSASFLLLAVFNWISFGLWLHFALRFPEARDLIQHKWWIPVCIYLLPAVTTIGGALYAAGFTPEFWSWVQRLRNLYLPFIIVGVFVKHAVDYKRIETQQDKARIRLPLIAYWLTFAPYLFFYLLPNLLLDTPFISFRTAVFAFFILPLAYFAGIIRYRLFEVDQIISRTLSYFAIIIGLSVIYSIFITFLRQWFFVEQVLSKEIFLFFLISMNIVFHPVILKLDGFIRQIFFKSEPISIKTMHQFSNVISATLHLKDIINSIIKDLPGVINIRSAAIMILENKRSRLFPEHLRFGKSPWPDSSIVKLFKRESVQYLSIHQVVDDIKLKKELIEIQKHGFSLILPLRSSQSLSAILFFGPKNSGNPYGETDIHLLASFANQTAIALENAMHHESLIESKKQLEIMFDQKVQSEKMAAIGEMTSVLAHELKNPLGIIHSSAQYLSDGKQSQTVQQEMLHYIKDEVNHLNLSINSILKLAKQKAPDFLRVDIKKQIQQLMHQWQHSDNHRADVRIDVKYFEPIPLIYADFRQLAQVLLNLIRNSEEMMENGGNIIIEVRQDENLVQILIIDDGPGIPNKNLDKVFQNFFTTKMQGMGLGLAACRQIIQAHNGEISLENRTDGNSGIVAGIKLLIRPLVNIEEPYLGKLISST